MAISSLAGDINHCNFFFWSKPDLQQTLYHLLSSILLSHSILFGQRSHIEAESISWLQEHHELRLNLHDFGGEEKMADDHEILDPLSMTSNSFLLWSVNFLQRPNLTFFLVCSTGKTDHSMACVGVNLCFFIVGGSISRRKFSCGASCPYSSGHRRYVTSHVHFQDVDFGDNRVYASVLPQSILLLSERASSSYLNFRPNSGGSHWPFLGFRPN